MLKNGKPTSEQFAKLSQDERANLMLWLAIVEQIDNAKVARMEARRINHENRDRHGFSVATIMRRYYAWKKKGWAALLSIPRRNSSPMTRFEQAAVARFQALEDTVPDLGNQKFKAELESYHNMSHEEFQNELEAIYRKLWSKVEDGLPDDDIEVLTYRDGTGLTDLATHSDDRWFGSDGYTIYGITHWMEIIPPEATQ